MAVDADVAAELAPAEALRRWIGDRLPGDGPFTVRRVTAGHSNELFELQRGDGRWLVRRPPRVPNAPGAHDMAREYRVLLALEGTDVPHPAPIALCEDADVIGAPFYVMERIDGVRLYDSLPDEFSDPASRTEIGRELFSTLARLHRLDWQAIGLDGFGRPENFTERQVPRWMKQLSTYKTRELPDLDAAAEWLLAHVPTSQRYGLIHGDYGLHNVLYAPHAPIELVAVLDWETSTIGDPLIDLGYLLGLWLEGDEPQRWPALGLPYDMAGFPPRADMMAVYAEIAGLDLSEIDWYRAVAQLKIACILEGGYARYVNGHRDDPGLAAFGESVPQHAALALAITRGDA